MNEKYARAFHVLTHRAQTYDIIRKNLSVRVRTDITEKMVQDCYRDYFWYNLFHGASLELDYFQGNLWCRSKVLRRGSLANDSRLGFHQKYRNEEKADIFRNRKDFYEKFKKFLGRDYAVFDKDTKYDKMKKFIDEHGSDVFVKKVLDNGINSARRFVGKKESDFELLYRELVSDSNEYVIEERIEQAKALKELNASSVNTVCILTVLDSKNCPHIASAALCMGVNEDVDNYSMNGLVAGIDVESGIVKNAARNRFGESYLIHPTSGKQIIGLVVPKWDEIKKLACDVAKVVPEVRVVSWNLALRGDGEVVLIGGNCMPNTGVLEALSEVSLASVIDSYSV